MTQKEFGDEMRRRFGDDKMAWRFVCPSCGHVASIKDWLDAGAGEGEVGFSCVGRHKPGARTAFGSKGEGPCNYAGGGLFAINPLTVKFDDGYEQRFFDIAEADPSGRKEGGLDADR